VPAPTSARLAVDGRAEAVLVPLYGATFPLHVLTIKNATHAVEGDGAAYVRLALGCGAGYEPAARHPAAALVKELAFRVADGKAAARLVAEIKALRASVAARDKERAERATLVAQEKLVKAAGRPPSLPDVWVRPAQGGKGRRVPGQLEAHANGFRFASPRGEAVDVMYRNIKHAFFQPAEGEAITLVRKGGESGGCVLIVFFFCSPPPP
jgi:nucleosome binding factor SPN SPT16 subunit